MAQTAVRAAWAVRISATLAFLGVGIQAPTPEWGAMIRQGRIYGNWSMVGSYISRNRADFLVFGLNLFGDGIQDILDPRRRVSK